MFEVHVVARCACHISDRSVTDVLPSGLANHSPPRPCLTSTLVPPSSRLTGQGSSLYPWWWICYRSTAQPLLLSFSHRTDRKKIAVVTRSQSDTMLGLCIFIKMATKSTSSQLLDDRRRRRQTSLETLLLDTCIR